MVRALLSGRAATEGTRWRSQFGFVGFASRQDIPIDLAALSRGMIRLAAEVADGIVLWDCPSSYIRDVVLPEIAAVRWATGGDMTGFDVDAALAAAATDDVPAAVSGIREELHRYFGLPFYRAMFSAAGHDADVAAYDAASGDRDAQLAAISERFDFDLCAIGDGPTVAQVLDRYRQAGAANPMITHIRGSDFESTLHAAAEQPTAVPRGIVVTDVGGGRRPRSVAPPLLAWAPLVIGPDRGWR